MLPVFFICIVAVNVALFYLSQHTVYQPISDVFEYIAFFVNWLTEYGQATAATLFVESAYDDVVIQLKDPENVVHYNLKENAWVAAPGIISFGGIGISLLLAFLLVFGSVDGVISRLILWAICGLFIHTTFWMDNHATEYRYLLLTYAFIFGLFAAFCPRIGKAILCLSLGVQLCLMNIWNIPQYLRKTVPSDMTVLDSITDSFFGSAWLWGLIISLLYAFILAYAIKQSAFASGYYFKFTEEDR